MGFFDSKSASKKTRTWKRVFVVGKCSGWRASVILLNVVRTAKFGHEVRT
jgi:hypothetical protein